MRKLATVERILDIQPIEDADKIEKAFIRGWQIVVEKDKYKKNELVIYTEIDSLMPERPEFEFLRSRGFRIRTISLRKQISQGIIFPMDILNNIGRLTKNSPIDNVELFLPIGSKSIVPLTEGSDVTELLGVTKYDPPMPACLAGIAKGAFPSHSIKTDENRIQNLVDIYEEYKAKYTWIATEKLDGSSTTYSIVNDEFSVSSRNLELKESDSNTFWKVAKELDIESKMRRFMSDNEFSSLTMQGELIGEGIQKNKYKLKGQTIRFFRVFDPLSYKFLPYRDAINAVSDMGLDFVPIIEMNMELPETINDIILYADGRSALYDTAREGIVFIADKIIDDSADLDRYQGRLSFKSISNKFILKHEE